MAEILITCIKKDKSGSIIQVGLDNNSLQDVEKIANEIWNNVNTYFINAMGIRVKVHAFRDKNNKPFLSSGFNNKMPNSLRYLPLCN